jgi:tetratricopeptide (TPR) repeat protein
MTQFPNWLKYADMNPSITDSAVKAAITAIASESATAEEKIQMLIEMAQGFQKKPKTAQDLRNAVGLFYRAYDMCGEEYPLLKARAQVGMSGTLQMIPDTGTELLQQARLGYEEALPILQQLAAPVEVAEVQMNLGLVLQSLVPFNLARITDSIQAYHEALRVFTWEEYPQEYAILYNNIAIAYLSMPMASEREYLRQGLAVQSFEVALKHINLIDHPREYAMLQNNLGNALQYLVSSHPVDNNLRAISAYNEALKVRNSKDTPVEYANTISNKANALFNLPDDPEKPELGNQQNLLQAQSYYQQAWQIFTENQQLEQAEIINATLQEIAAEIQATLVN